jgi:FtsP/CotA-like multicopper oxidase with cupredoxin domain
MELTRRDALKLGALGVAGGAAATMLPTGGLVRADEASELDPSFLPVPFTTPFAVPPILKPVRSVRGADGQWTDFYTITERMAEARILPGGPPTKVFTYNGVTPGPTIKTAKGRKVRLTVRNKLPQRHPYIGHEATTSVHLHGSASKPQYDGYASDITPPGFFKEYHYPNFQRARTLWYHDHGAHHTAQNVAAGLYAQYHLHDPVEKALLPQGEFDVPLIVGDMAFDANGQQLFDDRSHSSTYGDVIMVNGRPWPVMKVKRRIYRFRILVASVSRSFRWRLSDGSPMTVVATDGGLMPKSHTLTSFRHGPAERYEVLIDFSRYQPGTRVVLNNLSNDNNRDFANTDKVMAFDVVDEGFDKRDRTWNRIPDTLADSLEMTLTPEMARRRRNLRVERTRGVWTINGKTWDDVIRSNFHLLAADPDLNDVEIWRIENRSGGWFHPVHIHLVDFAILSRNGQPPFDYERGPKDVVYVGEGEWVDVVMKFQHQRGRYMIHCHNLTHEDHDMMQQFSVGWRSGVADRNDPVRSAPCKFDDLPES